jgi:hypothetical protein
VVDLRRGGAFDTSSSQSGSRNFGEILRNLEPFAGVAFAVAQLAGREIVVMCAQGANIVPGGKATEDFRKGGWLLMEVFL